jgi:hypothetical protein
LLVPEAVSKIRKRMGKTMAEFGPLIGGDHTIVSKYERAKTPPSKTVLILLLLLASDDNEKAPIIKALGVIDEAEFQTAYQDVENKLREYVDLEARSRKKLKKDGGRRDFVVEALAIAESRISLDPAIARILHRLRVSETSRKVQSLLRELDAALTEPNENKSPKPGKQRSAKTD